jgi:hypothetical protein
LKIAPQPRIADISRAAISTGMVHGRFRRHGDSMGRCRRSLTDGLANDLLEFLFSLSNVANLQHVLNLSYPRELFWARQHNHMLLGLH